jgi:hypothetical protein
MQGLNVVRAIRLLIRKVRRVGSDADFSAEVHEHLHMLTERYVRKG